MIGTDKVGIATGSGEENGLDVSDVILDSERTSNFGEDLQTWSVLR